MSLASPPASPGKTPRTLGGRAVSRSASRRLACARRMSGVASASSAARRISAATTGDRSLRQARSRARARPGPAWVWYAVSSARACAVAATRGSEALAGQDEFGVLRDRHLDEAPGLRFGRGRGRLANTFAPTTGRPPRELGPVVTGNRSVAGAFLAALHRSKHAVQGAGGKELSPIDTYNDIRYIPRSKSGGAHEERG